MSRLPTVTIYVSPTSETTRILYVFISKHIDQINKNFFIDRVNVTSKNAATIKKMGIDKTPTLVYNGKLYVSLDKIIRILTPVAQQKDNYGMGITSPEDLVNQHQKNLMMQGGEGGGDDDDDVDENIRAAEIKRKMTNMQKRRPQMDGVPKESKSNIKGGRKITSKLGKSSFASDEEFVKHSGIMSGDDTPSQQYADDQSGELILEEYYLSEANAAGKRVNSKNISRRK